MQNYIKMKQNVKKLRYETAKVAINKAKWIEKRKLSTERNSDGLDSKTDFHRKEREA